MTRAKDISKLITGTTVTDLTVGSSEPDLIIQDTDGTNQFMKIQQVGGASMIKTRSGSNDGEFYITGEVTGTNKMKISTSGQAYLYGSLDVSGAFTSQGIDDNADATAITIDSSENVGIGNTTPSSFYSLADNLVIGTGSGGHGLTIYSGSSDSGYIGFNDTASASMQGFIQYNHNGDYMAFAPNGSEKMRINSSGNVGIGVTNPNGKLVVNDPINNDHTTQIKILNSAGWSSSTGLLKSLGWSDGQNVAGLGAEFDGSKVNMHFHSFYNGGYKTETTKLMTIQGNGNVGIGVTPEATFAQKKTLRLSATASLIAGGAYYPYPYYVANNLYYDSSDNLKYIASSGAAMMSINAHLGGRFVFYTASTGTAGGTANISERMRIDSAGRVGVGVSSLSLHQMAVHGATGGNATFKVANTSSSGNTTTYLSFMDGSGANSANSAHFQGFNGAYNYYLLGNGTQTFTSDEIAKKNIETTRDGYLEDLAKLRVVKYNWKEDEDGTDKELGLIAQEVEKVFPKLVMLDIDPQIEEKNKKKMIKLSVLPLMLLKALQEANTKITALESRITTLEGA